VVVMFLGGGGKDQLEQQQAISSLETGGCKCVKAVANKR
jgi:hypothetical protein